jgi:hypothetical protein
MRGIERVLMDLVAGRTQLIGLIASTEWLEEGSNAQEGTSP